MIISDEPNLHRSGLGLKAAIRPDLAKDFNGGILDRIRSNGRVLTRGRITVRLAESLGFCYGVERAVQYAYEARLAFPDRRISLLSPVVHNPQVNGRLRELGIELLPSESAVAGRRSPFDGLGREDVVLVPAFGSTAGTMSALRALGCVVVDTTCGSVLTVWKSVERLARDGFTVVVHGNPDHEETRATLSRVDAAAGRWVVVRDLSEAGVLAERLRQCRMTNDECRIKGASAVPDSSFEIRHSSFDLTASSGFEPGLDLEHVGVAHQTTMLASESRAIAALLREAAAARWGEAALPERFRDFDTICTATQERQDAVEALCRKGVDLCIVVGGRTSHNTTHLAETAARQVPAYHIEGAEDLLDSHTIRHWNNKRFPVSGFPFPVPDSSDQPETGNRKRETRDDSPAVRRVWLPDGAVAVGVTAGASTPDAVTGAVVERVLEFA